MLDQLFSNADIRQFAFSLLAIFGVYLLTLVLRPVLRNLKSDIPLVILNVTQGPLLAVAVLLATKQVLPEDVEWGQRGLNAAIVAAVTFWVAQLITKVLTYYLKQYAEKSEAAWDDVLIPILEAALPIIIYLLGGFTLLQTLNIDLSGLWVALGGITFVLGFALRGILSNFFSGLVLLIDTPFQFGDVISMPDGSLAIIQKIGLRVTQLYIIETNCEMYVPNGQLEAQNITNLSRPSPSIYYSLELTMTTGVKQKLGMQIIREVVTSHPDTLGDIDDKLQAIEKFYTLTEGIAFSVEEGEGKLSKKEAGRLHLTAEKEVNEILVKMRQSLEDLVAKIEYLEAGGLEASEVRTIQTYYLDVLKLAGLELVSERQGKRKSARLTETAEEGENLLRAVRNWYECWSKDPILSEEDCQILKQDWEIKLERLKARMERLFQKLSRPQGDETRLDDAVAELLQWLEERFKSIEASRLYEPKIWIEELKMDVYDPGKTATTLKVKFFVDNIKLEQCQRGYRVKSEVYGEIMRRFRESYIY